MCGHSETKGIPYKSIVKGALKQRAAPPGQIIALQAFNALKEHVRVVIVNFK